MPAFLVTLPINGRFTLPSRVTDIVVFAADAADARVVAQAQFSGDSDAAWAAATATEIVAGADFSDAAFDLRLSVLDSTPVIDVVAEGGVSGVTAVALGDGGTATYIIDDILTAVGGTFTRAATFRVLTVSTGVILTVELVDPGEYTVDPSLIDNAVTGGGGSGALLDLTMGTDEFANFLAEMVGLLNATSPIADAAVDLGEASVGSSDLLLTVASIADGIGDKDVVAEFRRNGVAIPSLLSTVTDKGIAAAVLTVALPAAASRVTPQVAVALRQ